MFFTSCTDCGFCWKTVLTAASWLLLPTLIHFPDEMEFISNEWKRKQQSKRLLVLFYFPPLPNSTEQIWFNLSCTWTDHQWRGGGHQWAQDQELWSLLCDGTVNTSCVDDTELTQRCKMSEKEKQNKHTETQYSRESVALKPRLIGVERLEVCQEKQAPHLDC